METSFCELKNKIVVNIVDGSCLGHINDIIIDEYSGKICGLTVPLSKSIFAIFSNRQEIFIPANNICRIGTDVILVEVYIQPGSCRNTRPGKPCITK